MRAQSPTSQRTVGHAPSVAVNYYGGTEGSGVVRKGTGRSAGADTCPQTGRLLYPSQSFVRGPAVDIEAGLG